jgi:hypothetical protein
MADSMSKRLQRRTGKGRPVQLAPMHAGQTGLLHVCTAARPPTGVDGALPVAAVQRVIGIVQGLGASCVVAPPVAAGGGQGARWF